MRQQVVLGQISAGGLLLTVSALFYSRVFAGPGWVGPVIGAALLGGVLGWVISRTGLHLGVRAVVLGAIGFLFLLLTVLLPATNFGGFADLAGALRGATLDGWRNALASTLPIDTGLAEPLGFVTVVAWLTGAATGGMLRNSDFAVGPVIPAIVFAALSLPLAAPNGVAAYILIVALVAAALLLALVRAVPQHTTDVDTEVTEFVGERMLTERLIAGAPILVGLGLLAPLAAAALPGGPEEPFDPRQLRVEEVQSTSAINPLAELKAQREAAERAFLLDLPVEPPAAFFDRVGLVALETFNGSNWTTDATYQATSADLAAEEALQVESLEIRQQIELLDPSFPWVPAGNRPIRVNGDDIWFDDVSGTLLNRDGGDITYEVVSQVPAPTTEELRAASPDLFDARYRELPPIPDNSPLVQLADVMGAGETDFDQLLLLEETLRDGFTLVLDSSSGTSIGRLEQFLVEGEGYRDQFVSAFAVAARQQGFPTRVMVGYRVAEQTDDGTTIFLDTVGSEQYDAWPEVRFEGIGWVPFDPVPPTSGEGGGSGDDDATQIPEGQAVSEGPTPSESDPTEDDEVEPEDEAVGATVRVLVVSGLFLVLFPVMLLFMVLLIKLLRRRYRENIEDPTARVLAGWQESKDRLVEAGVDIRPDMTVKEIVAASRRDLGVHAASSLSALAPHVTSTIYASRPPTTETADIVWDEVDVFDRQLNESRGRLQTAKARVDPRPLIESV